MTDRIDELMGKEELDPVQRDRILRYELAWRSALQNPNCRRLVMDLLQICHYGLSPFTADNNTTNMISGKQKVGEHIMNMINATAPESYFLMIKEAKEDDDYDREQRDKRTSPDSYDSPNPGT